MGLLAHLHYITTGAIWNLLRQNPQKFLESLKKFKHRQGTTEAALQDVGIDDQTVQSYVSSQRIKRSFYH